MDHMNGTTQTVASGGEDTTSSEVNRGSGYGITKTAQHTINVIILTSNDTS